MKKPGTATITANAAQAANFEVAAPLSITVTVGSNPAVRAQATEDITTTGAKIGGMLVAAAVACGVWFWKRRSIGKSRLRRLPIDTSPAGRRGGKQTDVSLQGEDY